MIERTENRINNDELAIPFVGTRNPEKAPHQSSPRKYAYGHGSGAGWSSRRGGTESSESGRPLSEEPQISERLEDLARPLVRIYERQPPGTIQAKPPLPSLDCPTGRAYLETGLVVSELIGPDQKQGQIRAGAIYDRLSRRACRELRSSHGPNLISAGGDAEVLRVAWTPSPIDATTYLHFSRGPLLSRAHATTRQLEARPAEIAEATAILCEDDNFKPLETLFSPFGKTKAHGTPHRPVSSPPSTCPLFSPPFSNSYVLEALSDPTLSLHPPSANTPHVREVLKEVQNRKSLLLTPIEREWAAATEDVSDVKLVRAWKHESLPSGRSPGGEQGVSIPPNISEGLYRRIEDHLPRVAADAELRRALVYLKMVARPDPRSGYLPFHETAVAHIRGAPSLADRHEARVYDLAERLQEAVAKDMKIGNAGPPPFRVVGHAKGQNCVQITTFALPDPLEEAFSEEASRALLAITTGDLRATVNLESGNKGRPERRQKRRKRRRRKAERTGKRHDVPDRAQRLQQKLHDLPQGRFKSNLKSAKDKLLALAEERAEEQPEAGAAPKGLPYLGQLRAIADVSVPLYKFTGSTLRLTPAGPSLAALPKKMRRAVFSDYLEVDMSSAQLSLAGSLWDFPALREFLRECTGSDRSWWTELAGHLAEELPAPHYDPGKHFEAVKGTLKAFTYGLFFGMQRKNLRRLGNPKAASTDEAQYHESARKMNLLFLGKARFPHEKRATQARSGNVGSALLSHPLIEGLLRRREQLLSKIRKDGSITDCFGRSITTGEGRDPKSILAEYMQNAELRVMLPVGETVLSDPELKFGLWQHDGVTIGPRRRKPWAYRQAVEKTREALQRGREGLAEEMGVPPIETELTVDYGDEFLS
ncbi:hypothetical protein GGP53_001017 [Salinibacter ruber]|uniref:hypothetical protein n=1 Tax=Salinibacter ruber TaxID=146919 RepID=UPI00216A9820|nr:hypothetical protein [Salinibacter ruber]MCS3627176.1 hypothetical protein [Salinibacter ruber]MCS4144083.1 hypothetical protein [Salinibacter ruber]